MVQGVMAVNLKGSGPPKQEVIFQSHHICLGEPAAGLSDNPLTRLHHSPIFCPCLDWMPQHDWGCMVLGVIAKDLRGLGLAKQEGMCFSAPHSPGEPAAGICFRLQAVQMHLSEVHTEASREAQGAGRPGNRFQVHGAAGCWGLVLAAAFKVHQTQL